MLEQPRPMNLCVLGGTGFVGTELVERLVREGHWVRVPTRSEGRGDRLRVLDCVELCVANIHDPRTLEDLLRGMDAVINLVGILNESRGAKFADVHGGLPAKVVAAARTQGVPRLLHMSALGASPQGPSRYLRSKAEGERFVRAAGSLKSTIFRPSVIFGPGDSLTNRFAGLLRMGGGILPLARAGARFAPICVLDVIEAFLTALHRSDTVGETYELCGPQVLTLEEIVLLTAKVARLPALVVPLPNAVGRIQAALMSLVPGKPFSSDNYRSLTVDSVCRENGCARLNVVPRQMLEVLPTYLGVGAGGRTV
jgi:NADH dehydrogenase